MKHIKMNGLRQGQWVTCRSTAPAFCEKGVTHMSDKLFDYATEYFKDQNLLTTKVPTSSQMKQFRKQFEENELGFLAYRLEKLSDEEWFSKTIEFKKPANLTKDKYDKAAEVFIKTCVKAEENDVLIEMTFTDSYMLVSPKLVELFKQNIMVDHKLESITFKGAKKNVKNVVNYFSDRALLGY